MKKRSILAGLLVVALVLASVSVLGCSKKSDTDTSSTTSDATNSDSTSSDNGASADTTSTLYTPSYKPNGNEVAVFKTSKGTIKVKLDGKDAPISVGNFVELAQKGFYNGTKIHRYESGFVAQGGDPQTKDMTSQQVIDAAASGTSALGTGGPGYTIKEEYTTNPNNKHVAGTLAMARSNDPDSAGSQFYFALTALPDLDSGYTVFGQTTEGLDVVKALRIGDTIESVTIEGANK